MNFAQLLDPSSVPRDDADLALFQRELADVQPLAQDHVRSARRAGDSESLRARRAAAEQETDPELKEKLWKEYEEYKRNARK